MSSLLSVGLDVGTTSTQLVVSRLTVENRASSFAVPDMDITERNVLYNGPNFRSIYVAFIQQRGKIDRAFVQNLPLRDIHVRHGKGRRPVFHRQPGNHQLC